MLGSRGAARLTQRKHRRLRWLMSAEGRAGQNQPMGQFLWKLIAVIALTIGLVGAVLPVLPTVPLLLIAAAAAARGWPWLDARLLAHPSYGPLIRQWREHGAVPRAVKWFSTLGMIGSCAVIWWMPVPAWLRFVLPLAMAAVALWLWRRPER